MAGEVRTRIVIDADSRQAVRALDAVGDAAGDTERELDDLADTVRQLDGEQIKLDTTVDTSKVDAAQTEVADLRQLAAKPISIDLQVDDAQLDRVRRTGDQVRDVGAAADTLQTGIGPLRGFTDELSGTSAAAGVATNALIDAGEAVQIFGAQLGVSERTLGRVSLAMGGIGLAVGAATFAWSKYREAQEKARERTEQLIDVQEQLTDGKYREAAATLAETYGDLFTQAVSEGLEYADVVAAITSDTESLNLVIGEQGRVMSGTLKTASGEIVELSGITAGSLEALRQAWETANGELATSTEITDGLEAAFKRAGESGADAGDAGQDAARRIAREADDAARAVDDITAAYDELSRDVDQDRAWLRLQEQFDDVRERATDAWNATASGAADAESVVREYELAQLDLKSAVIDYADELGNIPPSVVSDVLAQIDAGSIDTVETALENLTKTRRTSVFIDLFQGRRLTDVQIPFTIAAPTNVTQNINVNATPSMRQVDAATQRWGRVNGAS